MIACFLLGLLPAQAVAPPSTLQDEVAAWVVARKQQDEEAANLALSQLGESIVAWRELGEARPLQRDLLWGQLLRRALRLSFEPTAAMALAIQSGALRIPSGDGPFPLVLVLHPSNQLDLSFLPATFVALGIPWPGKSGKKPGQVVALALASVASSGVLDRNRVFLLGIGEAASLAAQEAYLNVPGRYAAVAFTPLESQSLASFQGQDWRQLLPAPAFGFFSSPAVATEFFLHAPPRKPFPKQLSLLLSKPEAAAPGWWLQPVRFDPGGPGNLPAQLSVLADPLANTIRFRAHHVDEVRLFLNDALLDLDQPIHLLRNGEPTRFYAVRNVRTLLEHWATDLDDCALTPAQILSVDLPSRNP